jgi:hypothetical protein
MLPLLDELSVRLRDVPSMNAKIVSRNTMDIAGNTQKKR